MLAAWAILAVIAAAMVTVMFAAWAVQRAVGNSGWIDVFWTFGTGGAGAAAALLPFASDGGPSARQWLAAAIIGLWAVRLGAYIALRVYGTDREDARYARFREQWGEGYQSTLLTLILPQGLITAGLCASILIAAHRSAPGLDIRDAAGLAILLVAIAAESMADRQLSRFKAGHKEPGAICDTGLWAWSRHPNYFFEWFGWLAWPVIGLDPGAALTWLTLLAPALMYAVLRFMTGVPPLEATMLASRGAAFTAYQARTSAFFPLPPKHGA